MSNEIGAPVGVGSRFFYRFTWTLVWLLAKTLFRIRIFHRERIPGRGPFILAPIHRSYLDTPAGALVTARRLRWLVKESVWKSRLGGRVVTALGGFPVERGSADRAALRACQEALRRGEPMVMFPEGTRQHGPVVEANKMHAGPAFIALRAKVPIIPVGISGTDRAMPHGVRWIRPSKVVVVVGKPILAPLVEGRVPRRVVNELMERVRLGIQEAFDEAQVKTGQLIGTE